MRHITPYLEIEEESQTIQDFLDDDLPDGTIAPAKLVEYGNQVAVFVSRTGKMKADAMHHYYTKRKSEIFDMMKGHLDSLQASKTLQNELIKSICADELSLLEWCDRLNSSCSKRLSWCQSEIGLIKNEIIAGRGVNG